MVCIWKRLKSYYLKSIDDRVIRLPGFIYYNDVGTASLELCRDLNLSECKKRNLRSYLHLKQEAAASASNRLPGRARQGKAAPRNFKDFESLRCGFSEATATPRPRSRSATSRPAATLRIVPRLRKKEAIEATGGYQRDDYIPVHGKGWILRLLKRNKSSNMLIFRGTVSC